MAYTIIEVSQKTGVSPRTLRYWCDNGLFPLVEYSPSGIRYFSKSDIEWVEWVVRFRKMGMSVKRLREYINLAIKGGSTLEIRLAMIKEEKSRILNELDEIKGALDCVDKKIEFYETAIKAKADPHAKGGKKCE